MEPILSLLHVSKIYQDGHHKVVAVDNASLVAYPGEVILILGPSGSGKTTLLSIMGCLLSPSSGEVRVFGRDVSNLSDSELSSLRSQYIGFVFQSFNLLDFLSVRKNVEVVLNLANIGGRAARERATRILQQVQLDHRQDFQPKRLSGGEKQRVSVARALATNPRLLLADEPTGNLDSASGRTVVELLTGLARQQGSAVVIVTHDPRIMEIADRVLYLDDGRLNEGARLPAQAPFQGASSRAFATQ